MSMQDENEYDGDEQPEQDNLRELREAAKKGKASAAEAEGLKRELAFARAGIDTESPQGKMFVKAYDGELDSATIRGQFEGLFGTPATEATEPVVDEAAEEELRRQTQERRDLTAGGTDHTELPPADLVKQGYDRMDEAIQAGRPREFAFREALSGHIAAANAGQPGAVWDGWTDEQLDGWG